MYSSTEWCTYTCDLSSARSEIARSLLVWELRLNSVPLVSIKLLVLEFHIFLSPRTCISSHFNTLVSVIIRLIFVLKKIYNLYDNCHHVNFLFLNRFLERTDEAPKFWPPDAKRQVTGKDSDAGEEWRQKKKSGRGWDARIASPTEETWAWANSRT